MSQSLAGLLEDPRDQRSDLRVLGVGGFIRKRSRQLLNIAVHALVGCGAVCRLLRVFVQLGVIARFKESFVT